MKHLLYTPQEIARTLADRHKKLRLSKKWKRTTLAQRSGVSIASLIRFEQEGKISLESFLKLLNALGRLDDVEKLLVAPSATSIDELEKQTIQTSKRGSV